MNGYPPSGTTSSPIPPMEKPATPMEKCLIRTAPESAATSSQQPQRHVSRIYSCSAPPIGPRPSAAAEFPHPQHQDRQPQAAISRRRLRLQRHHPHPDRKRIRHDHGRYLGPVRRRNRASTTLSSMDLSIIPTLLPGHRLWQRPGHQPSRLEDANFVTNHNKFAIWIQLTPPISPVGVIRSSRSQPKRCVERFRFDNCSFEERWRADLHRWRRPAADQFRVRELHVFQARQARA